ncbi:bifunctional cytochrome P450/NADPH--P450 reductase [Archangium violaceum]|uniref:Bifunctional cytochrome P450/NADPH--P450 reductase n=1 Tax=Archangium violaceum Cb vi76 TaxID=1406225 RepID=A0A084T0B6_9BACT|nr:cytochrome P450 [Archangium violaceum]KFA94151.1 cytochrome P450 [Archangium violaceum Cb vi76]
MSKPALSTNIPQPRPRPLLGNAPDIGSEIPLQNMMKLARQLGPIFRLSFPGASVQVIGSYELVADACDEARFEKMVTQALQNLRALGGEGLFTVETEDPRWGKAHRLLVPAFSPAAMRDYHDGMLDVADQMLTRWARFGPETDIHVSDDMTRLTLDTIALCGFSFRFNSFYQTQLHPFVDSMVRALEEAGNRTRRLPVQTQLMVRTRRQFEADTGFLRELTQQLIEKRRATRPDEAPRDILSLMLEAVDPLTGERLDDTNIRDQLVTFLIAGHETTSGLLSFALYYLLHYPEVLQKAQAEVDRVFGAETPRFEQVSQLQYIDQILRETLRLWPTAPAFSLHAKAHDTLLGGRYPVGPDDPLLVLIPMLHRDPAVWKDPERFDPERFAPEVRDSIPPHAWKPFGNGMRACIGRAFAMQEATLVLGMMLQRFHLSEPEPYKLRIRETLTLKPDGLKLRVRERKPASRPLAPRPTPRPAVPVSQPSQPSEKAAAHGTPLLLLYGSNSGASEAFARRIASDGLARGYSARVSPLDEYTGKLPTEGAVFIVTASYNGKPPDNARAFHAWVSQLPEGSLKNVRYAVFGCGNKDWGDTYQAVPRHLDERLSAAGAQRLFARGEADARADFFGEFEQWYAPFWDGVGTALGVSSRQVASGPLFTVEVVPSASVELVRQNKLELATVVENRELVDMTSPFGRSKRHLVFKLPEGVTYAAGDYLAVLPENHPELVERAARRFGVRTDAAIVLRSTRGDQASSLPTGRPLSVQELLGRHVELSAPATRKDLERLAEKNPCPPHAMHLAALAQDAERYKKEILDKRVSVLDLLEQYDSCILSFGDFLELLPAMRVRQYSVSSSPLADATRCTLTVAVVDAEAWSGRGRFHGTCSSYLARLRPGEQAAVAVRTPNVPFYPPTSNATPIILVGAGTGLAPFRGFLQERALRHARGETAGPALLFFGCDHPDVDFLYRDELAKWEREGVVEVLPAFFRQPDGDVTFVQHRLWKERARVKALLGQGALFFICGDGQRMAPAVRETLARLHQEAVGCSAEEATEWLSDMEKQGRLVSDVFT